MVDKAGVIGAPQTRPIAFGDPVVGHVRYKGAQKLGLKQAPVHVARDLSPAQVRAYRLADNKTAEAAAWDPELLPLELRALSYHNPACPVGGQAGRYRGRVCRYLRAREHVGQLFYEERSPIAIRRDWSLTGTSRRSRAWGRRAWRLILLCEAALRCEARASSTPWPLTRGTAQWPRTRSVRERIALAACQGLALRGTEGDAEAVARFACSRRFWTASVARRVAMLERYLDVARLFRGYTWRDLPTRYLRSYTAPEKIKRADEGARRRTGGVPWGPAVPPGGAAGGR